jgi:cytochrome b6-f complex iron-sulfur subunit
MNNDKEKTPAAECEASTSRRGFIRHFLFGSAATWAVAACYGLFRFFAPPKVKGGTLPKYVDVGKSPESIAVNSGLVYSFGSKPALLIRDKSGGFRSYFATCPHLACTVQYDPQSRMIICPCHEGVFDLNGKNVSGPPTEPLVPLIVHLSRDNKIRIERPGTEGA